MSHRALLPLSAVSILLALVALLAPIAGCGKANPVAPSGSTLTLRVSPTTIPSPRGSATATATLIKPNGTPDNGAQVQFSTTLGSFNPTVASTKSDGNAVSTLTGNGTAGIAKVSAFSGDVMTTAELDVTIGGVAKTITLQAIPANISTIGGSPKLVALVRDSLGQPAAGVQVNFTTTVGTLASRGGFKATNASGEATDTLTVLPSDLTNQTSITVTATAAAADGTLQTATAMIAIVNPNAAASVSVSASPGQISATASNAKITLTALVLNAEGVPIDNALVIFSTTLGTVKPTSAQTDPNAGHAATSTLTVASVPAGTTGITVTAQSPGVGGALVSGTTTITITP